MDTQLERLGIARPPKRAGEPLEKGKKKRARMSLDYLKAEFCSIAKSGNVGFLSKGGKYTVVLYPHLAKGSFDVSVLWFSVSLMSDVIPGIKVSTSIMHGFEDRASQGPFGSYHLVRFELEDESLMQALVDRAKAVKDAERGGTDDFVKYFAMLSFLSPYHSNIYFHARPDQIYAEEWAFLSVREHPYDVFRECATHKRQHLLPLSTMAALAFSRSGVIRALKECEGWPKASRLKHVHGNLDAESLMNGAKDERYGEFYRLFIQKLLEPPPIVYGYYE